MLVMDEHLWKMWTMSFVKYVYDICFMFELYVKLYVWKCGKDGEKIHYTQVCHAMLMARQPKRTLCK